GAQHVGAGMGEVENAHHAENEREPARQHEQQHAVDEPVQKGDDKDFHCSGLSQGEGPPPFWGGGQSNLQAAPGRFILQVLAWSTSLARMVAVSAQPRPVPSASYFTPFLKMPTNYSLIR